ncbi:hypothetical protein Anapl_16033 [Anas platyrhynchos]|uniref:Uncharacterized protein n=1 Tax=Anas platyrhynchos TaxID=8839 RepID=R0JAY4_ANAPL|nr:hypothetical protein Anapl_16033 [Anas platyrhynchos]
MAVLSVDLFGDVVKLCSELLKSASKKVCHAVGCPDASGQHPSCLKSGRQRCASGLISLGQEMRLELNTLICIVQSEMHFLLVTYLPDRIVKLLAASIILVPLPAAHGIDTKYMVSRKRATEMEKNAHSQNGFLNSQEVQHARMRSFVYTVDEIGYVKILAPGPCVCQISPRCYFSVAHQVLTPSPLPSVFHSMALGSLIESCHSGHGTAARTKGMGQPSSLLLACQKSIAAISKRAGSNQSSEKNGHGFED